jgi:hypothetical protein
VHADRHVRERIREDECTLEHVLWRDAVRDVDDLDVRRDPLDDTATNACKRILEAEVGQEGDEPTRDAASLTARVTPSRS